MKKARMGIKQRVQRGFTLIELMIVVAIIGILAAIAIPQYQDYVSKSQVARAVSELSAYKTAVEDRLNQGDVTISNDDLGYTVSNLTTGALATNIGAFNADGSGTLVVTLGNQANKAISAAVITLSRDKTGAWTCGISKKTAASFKDSYGPPNCTVGA
ncbi:hypothetical protein D9X30_1072 [Cupriavidus sp. U2]|uniref:pilin n=1 Tax=Cupriavidus sp. U2 TaxID=2920269 RepID=UPI00129D2C9F|nr:pilin [Cupriavidus sp. U2]KAI3593897.1 hypothetical protein D9X30_1072 [Cupriavidus sp. U2]